MALLERPRSTSVDNFKILNSDRVTIPIMTHRTIVFIWFIFVNCNLSWSSDYIFVEDTGSIGSLKGLLQENIRNDNIEILGYTSKSLNVVLNKTNKLQTSMAWLLREGYESEAMIISRCGKFQPNQYIEDRIKILTNKKSKMPRLYIGWIPYKRLGQITSQCVVLDVPQSFDLDFLSVELSELFSSNTEVTQKDISNPPQVTASSTELPPIENAVQQAKKVPMKWDQFTKVKSKQAQQPLNISVQKLSYDPDEDLFLNPFVNVSSDMVTKNITNSSLNIELTNISMDSRASSVGPILLSSKSSNAVILTSPLKGNVLITRKPNLNSEPDSVRMSSFTENLHETLNKELATGSKSSSRSTSKTIQKTKKQNLVNQLPSSTLTALKSLDLNSNSKLPQKLSTAQNGINKLKITTNGPLPAVPSKKDDLNNPNLLDELKLNFRRELLNRFRKEKGRQAPEWLFEE